MLQPIILSTSQQFEVERLSRAIDNTIDTDQLRALAKQLLNAWQTQRAATTWVMQHQFLTPLAVITPETMMESQLAEQSEARAGEA